SERLEGAGCRTVADPPARTQVTLASAPRRRRLLHRPRCLRSADQGSLGALLRRAWHRPRLGLSADAVDRSYGRRFGPDNGSRTAAHCAATPGCLGPVDGGTAPALGRFRVGVLRTGRQLWGATGLLGPRLCPV